MNLRIAILATPGMLLLLAGCAAGLEQRQFATRVIPAAEPDAVVAAADSILRREFGRVRREDGGRLLVSEPVEFSTSSESGTTRDLYAGRSRMRRVATLSAAPRGAGTVARLRIDVEREDTSRREPLRPDEFRLTDSPAATPVERDAATAPRQNTVWTFVKRDLRLERALLDELQDQFAPEPPEAQRAATQPGE